MYYSLGSIGTDNVFDIDVHYYGNVTAPFSNFQIPTTSVLILPLVDLFLSVFYPLLGHLSFGIPGKVFVLI